MEDGDRRTLTVEAEEEGVRLDSYLTSKIEDFSRNRIQKLNKEGFIKVDNVRRPDHYPLKAGNKIEITLPLNDKAGFEPVAQDIPLKIVYEDESIIVVNKGAGMVVHPAHGNWEGTLINALLGRGTKLSKLGGPYRPGVVHRLDKDTTGLVVLAKSDRAYEGLAGQIKQRRFGKVYHAIAWGNIGQRSCTVKKPIGRHPVHRQKMTVLETRAREAETRLFVIDSFKHFDYIRVTALTGRTHQIRVHLSHIQHPLLGDPVYGGRRQRGVGSDARTKSLMERVLKSMKRHALHASELVFEHPATGSRLSFKTALPDDMRRVLEVLYLEDWFKEAGF